MQNEVGKNWGGRLKESLGNLNEVEIAQKKGRRKIAQRRIIINPNAIRKIVFFAPALIKFKKSPP
jgi:hypothetical protein